MPSHQSRRDPLPAGYQFPTVTAADIWDTYVGALMPSRKAGCPQCHGPSTRGDLCLNCTTKQPLEPTAETPWGV